MKIGSLASASMLVPKLVSASNLLAPRNNGRSLVVIQLSGGNDGLNTLVPYRNDIYYQERPRISIPSNEILQLTEEMGLHPSLTGLHDIFHNGGLSVLNSVGYPNPNRSHFRSMDIWHSASSSDEHLSTGWLGRLMDVQAAPMPYHALELDDTLSLAMKGEQMKGLAIKDPAALHRQLQHPFILAQAKTEVHNHQHKEVAFLRQTLRETSQSVEYVYEKSKVYKSSISYPNNALGKGLKTIAELIISECNSMVYYVSQDGFDTHAGQEGKQKKLLKQYDEAVSAFVKDLKANGKFDDTLVMTFSEFGRRVAQNASGGTDHGTANNVLLMSGKLKSPGIFNEPPDLKDLDNGDLKYQVDFRQIYTTVLQNWLSQSAEKIIGQQFYPLPII